VEFLTHSALMVCSAQYRGTLKDVIDRQRLAQALSRRPLADWVIFEHDQEFRVLEHGRSRSEVHKRWRLVVHADTPKGRGTARIAIDANEGDPDELADRGLSLALAAIGPAWESPPAAAPARVELADPSFASDELDAIADRILHATASASGTVRLMREHVGVATRQGFHADWQATLVRADLLVVARERSLAIVCEARRVDELELERAIADATADLQLLASAGSPAAGPCAVVLAADALVPDGLGVWAAFAAQADAVLAREGLARYHERSPIAVGAHQSAGGPPSGVPPAPWGADGDAVRTFAIVERGIAAGLGLSPREAALRGRDPNGGVRNLVVRPGTWDGRLDPSGRVIEIKRLRELAIDPYTGDASLEIALAVDHGKGPFAGGTVRLDLVDALARARRASTRIERGPYDGP
jgi:hypothetical protein